MGSCMSSDNCSEESSESWTKEIDSQTAEFLACEAKNDEHLTCLEGRMCTNGATSIASLHTQQGKKGSNQDSMIIWENFGSREDTVFLGVFDGHGPYGHIVGRRVRDSLPSMLLNQWHELLSAECLNSDGNNFEATDLNKLCNVVDQDQQEKEPKIFQVWKESHLRAFKVMDKELKLHPTLDCHCSGTTAVTIVKQGQDLVIAHVGDSRAIMGTISPNGSLSAIQLTVDMKANLPEEAERIKQCKGRVIALQDEPHVHRVWLPNENSPGLAMTRAFGDFCLKEYGVIAIPKVTHKRLTNRDQFIVLATDGVWDVLSNDEVANIVYSASSRAAAAKMVVESAVHAWRHRFPTSKIDDCAVVCMYLDSRHFISEHGQGNSRQGDTNSVVLQPLAEVPLPTMERSETIKNNN
ncbi:hypothetical protein KI387_014770, partial [Taxus chinensis]